MVGNFEVGVDYLSPYRLLYLLWLYSHPTFEFVFNVLLLFFWLPLIKLIHHNLFNIERHISIIIA